jgi:hypothetical protein
MARAPKKTSDQDAAQRFVWQTHPLYQAWWNTWKLLAESYEGDGGYLDGTNLVPHPRELVYPLLSDGTIDPNKNPIEKDKFRRRRQLARYENFAQALVDLMVDHQYTHSITRTFGDDKTDAVQQELAAKQPITEWWKNVDGLGTSIDDWMKQTQVLANVFGHVFVVMDRPLATTPPQTAAEEGRPYLRVYTPLDALDWLAPQHKLTAVKFIEAQERTSLQEASTFAADTANSTLLAQGAANSTPRVQYRVWTDTEWTLYNAEGGRVDGKAHGLNELPVLVFYSHRRARLPILGRSLLRDPKLFKDHFNLVSEAREILRGQTFSMLKVKLGEAEEIGEARSNLGNHAGIDSVLFTKGDAEYIAPPDGPVKAILDEIRNVERKMFRLIGIGEDTDSHAPETEGSRRLKAMDLNRLLAGHAAEAQRFEMAIARLWFLWTYGPDAGQSRWEKAQLTIQHPDEFYVEEMADTITNTLEALEVPMGEKYSVLVRVRAIKRILPDLNEDDAKDIEQQIKDLAASEAASEEANRQALVAAQEAATNVRLDAAGRQQVPTADQPAPTAGQSGQPGAGGKKRAVKRSVKKTPKPTPPKAAAA